MLFAGIGEVLTAYRHTGVSIERLVELMPGSSPEKLVERNSTHLFRRAPNPVHVEKNRSRPSRKPGGPRDSLCVPRFRARRARHRPLAKKGGRSPSSQEGSVPARARCCACCWVHSRCKPANCCGMAERSTTRARCWFRRALPTRLRSRACSARNCAATSCWVFPRTGWTFPGPSAPLCWNATSTILREVWTLWSGRVE